MRAGICVVLILLSTVAWGAEADYSDKWCKEMGGTREYTLPDLTRVDCLLTEYAVEVEFAPKWAESIGQSLYYAMETKRKPGVVLVLQVGEERFLVRLLKVAWKYDITVWVMLK